MRKVEDSQTATAAALAPIHEAVVGDEGAASSPDRWLPFLITLVLGALWEILSRAGLIPQYFFPPPSAIGKAIVDRIADGKLLSDTGITLSRLTSGFLAGGLIGLLTGLAMGYSHRMRRIVDPFIAALHPVPKLALFPLIMIIFGIGEASKVVLVALGVFFPMLINSMAGVRQISPIHFEVAENFGAGRLKIFTRVILPGSMPLVLAGARVALNTALLVTIAVELVSARAGLGAMIWLGWQTFRIQNIYAGIVVIGLIGIGMNFGLARASARLVPWQAERHV